MKNYAAAVEVAEKGLPPTHPIRLGNEILHWEFF